MLIAVGGPTVLGTGTAGANTDIQTVTPSFAKLGTIGTMTMKTISCTITIAVGTHQCPTISKQLGIKRAGTKVATALFTAKLLLTIATSSGTKSFKKGRIDTANVTIKSTATTGINNCKILALPTLIYSKTASLKLISNTNSLAGVSVTGCAGGSSVDAQLASELTGSELSSTITFNQI